MTTVINHIFQAISKYGGIDILISNAAINPVLGPVLDVSNIVFKSLRQS